MALTELQLLDSFMADWYSDSQYITAHTSGSTGTPKPIRLLKSDMAQSSRATCRYFGIDGGSTLGLPLSLNYIAGKMMAVRSIVSGAELVQIPVSNRLEINRKIDLLSIVPSQVESLLNDVERRYVGRVIIGGAPLSADDEQRLIDAKIDAYASYGMTETCSHVALRRLGTQTYEAMPGITFGCDKRGCLTVSSEVMSFGTLITNDLVTLFSPTAFQWLGRYDNVINSGGVKIMPEQLEARLKPVVRCPFYITSQPDPKWGEAVVLVAECGEADLDAVRHAVEAAVHGAERPRAYRAVNQLPRTANGKLKRRP